MSRIRRIIATVTIFAGSALPTFARQFDDIEVVVQPQPAVESGALDLDGSGYIEHRVVVRNRSQAADHVVRLIEPPPSNDSLYSDYLGRNSRTVQVNHGSTMIVSLFQPLLPVVNEGMAVEIDGVKQLDVVELPSPFQRGYGAFGMSRVTMAVLASRGIPQNLKDDVRAAHSDKVIFCRSELAVNDWSPHWLGYTAYDVVLITQSEAESLPADVRLALRRYVETGGILLVHGASDSPTIIPAELRDAGSQPDGEGVCRVGFGVVRPCPTSTPWPTDFSIARAKGMVAPKDRAVEILSDVSTPLRGLLLVVICFAIGIGPVNVWLLTRRQKRMWLWWNVPIISLATCLAIFSYALASEGITGRGRTALLTLLDENTHRATTIGYASYYCPLTPSDGLRFSYDTEVTSLRANNARLGIVAGRAKTVDWTVDQHLASGWVVARVPVCFAVCKSETRRERLAIHKAADGNVSVVNGLGVAINSLYYVDADGRAHVSTDIAAGAEQALQPAAKVSGTPSESLREVFQGDWASALERMRRHPEDYVAAGCYVAVVQQSPFLEDPLPTAPQDGGIGVVYGIVARSGDGR